MKYLWLFVFLFYSFDAQALCQNFIDKAQEANSDQAKRKYALEGIVCAEECLKQNHQNVNCVYERAVSRGLLLESRTVTYKTHLKMMIDDFQFVAEVNPKYDESGALRALAEVFHQLPSVPVVGSTLFRDLDRANSYIDRALTFYPENPENQLVKAKILFKKKDFANSYRFLLLAQKLQNQLSSESRTRLNTLILKAKKKIKN